MPGPHVTRPTCRFSESPCPIGFRSQADSFAAEGFSLVPDVIRAEECESISAHLQLSTPSGGTRCLLPQSWCASLARRLRQHMAPSLLVPTEHVAVQCTYFEKSLAHNWLVPIHQDLSIPVADRVDEPSLRGWSEKEGSLFVQAPVDLLEQLVAVRVHLDACTADDGPLRVVPGSHLHGRIEPNVAVLTRNAATEMRCQAEQGAALVMRPLLLHASSKAAGKSRRRVLHFVFGPRSLPHGLRWQYAV
ncbi:phytanoyl-CoA dioxygenase family protein [Variovorax sp. LjRoot290]|uniref:phytanoyl-CoA dioxygenase family protein n=1 Tax=Variovorax sp. LjRoot290 TaxID=3342316 RepID=UPI003F517B62